MNGGSLRNLHPTPLHWASLEKTTDAFLCLPFSFALISDKRYQKKEPLISSVHTKVKGIAEVKAEILENGMKKMVSGVFDTADYTFPLQVSSCQQLPRTPPWSLSPGPLPPSSGTQSLMPEKHQPYFKKLCENPNRENLKIAKLGQIQQLKDDTLLYQVLRGFSK